MIATIAAGSAVAQTTPIDTSMYPPLYEAAERGDLAQVHQFVEDGASPNLTGGLQHMSLLEIAALKRNYEVAQFLIEKGADVNYKSLGKVTALNLAIGSGDLRIVDLLLQKGANINSKDDGGITPLHCAATAEGDKIQIFDRLLKAGADIDAKAAFGVTVLHEAVGARNLKIVRRIVGLRPALVNVPDGDGMTPAKMAEIGRNRELITALHSSPNAP